MSDELKGCPFCGDIPRIIRWKNYKDIPTGGKTISCENDDCSASLEMSNDDESILVSAWNTCIHDTELSQLRLAVKELGEAAEYAQHEISLTPHGEIMKAWMELLKTLLRHKATIEKCREGK